MKFSLRNIALCGAALATALVLAADGKILKYAPANGSIRKYKLSAVFDAGGAQANVTGEVTEKVLKVDDATGRITQERSQGPLSVDVAGQTINVDAQPATIHVIDSDGSLVEMRGEGLNPAAYRLSNLSSIRFTKEALSEGKTWKLEIPADSKTGAVKATAEYKVLGFEKLMDIDTVKISATVKETEGDTPASSDGTAWLNLSDGTLVKYDGSWTNAPINPAPMPISGKYTLTLVQ